jgi:hypothetical protein
LLIIRILTETATYIVGFNGGIPIFIKLIFINFIKDINKTKMTTTSICIPRVDLNISKKYIENIIYNMKIGSVEKLNEFPLYKDPQHKRVIIKIRWNTNNSKAKEMLEQMNELGKVNLVYDMPWYWRICPAR